MTALTPEAERELHVLRRRAYGPDPGSPLDHDEVARLSELEAAVRAPRLARAESPTRASQTTIAAGDAAAETAVPAASVGPPVAPAHDPQTPSAGAAEDAPAAARRPWWRRRATWIAAVVGIGAGVAGTLAGVAAGERAPDVVLHRLTDQAADGAGRPLGLDYLLGDPDSLRLFGDWQGMTVWTVRRPDATQCLLLEVDSGLVDWGCGVRGFDPQIDLWVFPGMRQATATDLPVGSTVRFVARGDRVEVWVDRAGDDAEGPITGG